MYKERKIDVALLEWSQRSAHKTLLLRGARQVGKTFAVRHLGEQFENFSWDRSIVKIGNVFTECL